MTNKTGSALDGLPAWVDPVVVEMFKRLPIRNSEWPLDQRILWLQAMESVLHMVYGPVEKIDIGEFLEPVKAGKLISDEPTDEVMARDVAAASGSRKASTTKAADEAGVGSERSSSSETTKAGRPAGIPSNLAMAVECIGEKGPSSAPQIREWARKKYWPGMPESWTAVLYDFVKSDKLARAGLNFILPVVDTKSLAPPPAAPKNPAIVMSPKPPSPAKPAPPPPAKQPIAFKFDHEGKSAELGSSRCFVLASKLRAAMGKGHVAEAFLAENVIGSNTERNRALIKDLCMGMNPALADVGLKIEYYQGFGLIMKAVE